MAADIDKITQTLKDYFEAENLLPDPYNYPNSYMWYVIMYHHMQSELNRENDDNGH